MTSLEFWKAEAEKIAKEKKKAIAEGKDTIMYTDPSGHKHKLYYHSGRWNDRPSTVGAYHGQI